MIAFNHLCKISAALWGVLLIAGGADRACADPLYTLEHIGRRDGLPQSSVRAIAVDKLGFLWIGTETGVARYDGYRFKEITPPFGHGVVMSLHADARGRQWIRWYGKPLTLYDPIREQWQVMGGADAVDTFDGYLEDPSGTVWLSRSTALLYYDETARHMVVAAALDPNPDPNTLYWPPRFLSQHRLDHCTSRSGGLRCGKKNCPPYSSSSAGQSALMGASRQSVVVQCLRCLSIAGE
jgi:hypothetical protein